MVYFVDEYTDDAGRPIVELRCNEHGKDMPGQKVDSAGFMASWRLRDELAHMERLAAVPIVAPAQVSVQAPTMPAPAKTLPKQPEAAPLGIRITFGRRAA